MAISPTESPDNTERSRGARSSAVAKRSRCLRRSQLFASFVRTSAKDPFSFSPRSSIESFPFAIPSRTWRSAASRSWNQVAPPSSGEYTPQSHTITSPAPYCPAGITPSNDP